MTNMDIVQLAAVIAAICLRAARLLAVARPLLNAALPSKVQPWVAAALVFLPELAAQVAGDRTELDLMESLLLALALLVPGGDSKDPPAPPKVPTLPIAMIGLFALACSEMPQPSMAELEKACPPAFVVATVDCPAMAIEACHGVPWNECPMQDELEAKCDAMIAAKVDECRH
jgi:hypothetical protein